MSPAQVGNTSSNVPLQDFMQYAKNSDTRLLAKDGTVVKADSKIDSITSLVSSSKAEALKQENITTGREFKAALQREHSKDGLDAFSPLEYNLRKGDPITRRNVQEVKQVLQQLKIDPDAYKCLSECFKTAGRDPRMIALLEDYKPGCFDGKVKQLAKEHVGKPATDVWNDTKKGDISGPVKKAAKYVPVIGNFVGIVDKCVTASKECDKELFAGRIGKLAEKPETRNTFAHNLTDVLYEGHEKQARKAMFSTAVDFIFMPLGAFNLGPVGKVGIKPIVNGAVDSAVTNTVGNFAAKQAYSLGLTGIKAAANHVIPEAAANEDSAKRMEIGILPRLEATHNGKEKSFELTDTSTVRALLRYLGPAENTHMSKDDFGFEPSDEDKELELNRMVLKTMLGSEPSEELEFGSKTGRKSDKALLSLMNDQDGVLGRVIDGMNTGKDPHFVRDELNQQFQDVKKDGVPSYLRMLYLSEGWMRP
ncbi:hypothetical protein [Photobacterium alginatilyticum]|uniref:Uncharacterized protein n=1 Tax=Photobacterium alginatilyticum TaxID=1775171 RepID=A0ABW9YDH4_9GAMM|nr:hypothetical protein [Photobacterium alginatilyticum]NBI51819.1 hypothetical protein [Photobacterium alginatilyticum]